MVFNKLFLLGLLLGITIQMEGCTQNPPKELVNSDSVVRTYNASFDDVWYALAKEISDNYPIEYINKDTGRISTRSVILSTRYEQKRFGFTPVALMPIWSHKLTFHVYRSTHNVTVEASGNFEGFKSKAKPNWITWASNGRIENSYLDLISNTLDKNYQLTNLYPRAKTTRILVTRNNLAYIPNEDEPFSGRYVEFYDNGKQKAEISYLNGLKNGLYTMWYENGHKKGEVNFKNDKENGIMLVWYKNGGTKLLINYLAGIKNGLTTEYHENGQKTFEVNYQNDKESGAMLEWYDNGNLKSIINYQDGVRDGLFSTWYENGKKESEILYANGIEQGAAKMWNPDGSKKSR